MLSYVSKISGLWRLCLVLCLPIWICAAAYYFIVLDDEPQLPYRIWLADETYNGARDLQLVYWWNFGTGQRSPPNKWVDTVAWIPTQVSGYHPHGCSRWTELCWVQVSKALPPVQYEKAQQDALEHHQASVDARYWRQFNRAAQWLLLSAVPLFLFWSVVFASRWVRAGFATAD